MKQSAAYLMAAVLVMLIPWTDGLRGQETPGKTSELTVPWDEFKAILNLDEDEIVISVETFQKLLAQTGIKTTPARLLQGGQVVLTRKEFADLVGQMKPPVQAVENLPFDYLVTKALYSGKVEDGGTTFAGTFTVHVLKEGAYLKVPLLPLGIALEDVTVDGEQALVISENGSHHVVLSDTGEYRVATAFSLKSAAEKGPNKIDLPILQTPITLLRLELPLKGIDVEIPQAQSLVVRPDGDATLVTAVITQGRSLSVRWRKQIAPTERIPSKLYADMHHLVSIEDGALSVHSDIHLNILYSEIDQISLAVPADMNVLTVTGEGVGDWQETIQEGQRRIRVPFTYGQKGPVTVRVTAETALADSGSAHVFSGIQVLESVRETGFIGIGLNTSAEVIVAEIEGLEPVAVQKLPAQLINKSNKPLTLGFKYLRHPYRLVLEIKKHRKVAVPVATINSANVVTLFTDDGKVIHRMVYQVRNNAKQFLAIRLPPGTDVWSVFVNGQPVESSLDDEARLLVPLIRSLSADARLTAFPVEVIYCQVEEGFSWLGSRAATLPAADLLISQLMWSVYLPDDYSYLHFSSTLEIEEMVRGLNILTSAERRYNERAMKEISELGRTDGDEYFADKLEKAYEGKDYRSSFRNVPVQEEQIVGQLNAELEFAGRLEGLAQQDAPQAVITAGASTGVLPIHIQVPTGGQVYRFARTIVKTEDPLSFTVTYSRSWVAATTRWLVVLGAILLLYLNRKRFSGPWQRLKVKVRALFSVGAAHRRTFEKMARSSMTPVVLLGLLAVFWTLSRWLSLLLLFLLWTSAAYHILAYRRRRAAAKTGSASQAGG